MNIYRERKKINKERKKINRGKIINQDILKVSIFFFALAMALIVALCIFVTFDSSAIINNTYNKRASQFKKTVKRGDIYDINGNVLAYSEIDEEGNETRIYPYENIFAHVVGYESMGGMGLESSYNYYLLTSHTNMFEKISNEFNGEKNPGDSIHTSLDASLQGFISDILGEIKGAVVCLDPTNGQIYAMVSKPDFNPNSINEIWDEIIADEDNSPLINRVTQGQYAPGSTFKIFTLLEYIRENPEYINYYYDCEGSITDEGITINCHDNTVHGPQDLIAAFANSCNCAFADIGLQLNILQFVSNNNKLLFNTDVDIDIAYNEALFNLNENDSRFMIMQTAFGQGETVTNPMHLALVMSAIANDGILMKPHMVTHITAPNNSTVKRFKDEKYEKLFSEEECEILKVFLRAVVTDGTAMNLNSDYYTAYGKTGTAETNSNKELNHDQSWFCGYAQAGDKKLVICSIIENVDESYCKAVDLAQMIFDYYF